LRKEEKMKSTKILAILAAVATLALLLAASGVGAFPQKGPRTQGGAPMLINYQGRLTDPTTGRPKPDDDYSMRFKLYDAETGGNLIWAETQTVPVSGGLFNVLLGSENPLSATHFSGTERWLEVVVDGQTLSPRQRIASVAYSIQAQEAANADTLDGSHASDFAEATHDHWGETWSGSGTGLSLSGGSIGLDATGTTCGVYGLSASTEGYGVYGTAPTTGTIGIATATSGTTYGVYGKAQSFDGYGGYFKNTYGSGGYFEGVVNNGIEVSAGGHGVLVSSAGYHGIYVSSASEDGVHVGSADTNGVHVGSAGEKGVYVYSAGENGVHVSSADMNGVYVWSAGGHGFHVRSATYDGVYVRDAGRYGGYFNGDEGSLMLTGAGDGDDGTIHSDPDVPNSDLVFFSNDNFHIHLDENNDQQSQFRIYNGANTITFQVDANGNLTASGSKAGYVVDIALNADVQPLQLGDVVVIVGSSDPVIGEIPVIEVRKASGAYLTGIAGVVSQRYVPETNDEESRSGFVKLEGDEGVAPGEYLSVVTLGAFKAIKVDASYGSIRPGDLLVSSPTPGYAMKASDRIRAIGAVIGKALGSLESGTGVIPVLVTLQ
jgi:hypothetical protein